MPVDLQGHLYRGKKPTGDVVQWTCPACRAENLSDLSRGCPACGAGTPAQAEAAVEAAKAAKAELVGKLDAYVVQDAAEVQAAWWLMLEGYTRAARQTVAHALEHYAADGMREEDDLPMEIQIAWARKLLGLEVEGAGVAAGVAEVTDGDRGLHHAPPAPDVQEFEGADDGHDTDDDGTILG